jgi:hypothetical protein
MSDKPSSLARIVRLAALIFLLVLGGIGVATWLQGDPETLPFDYEGFD